MLFFLTPIFWAPDQMQGKRRIVIEFNPLAHLLEVLRQPLLGRAVAPGDWIFSLGFLAVLALTALVLMAMFRRRIVFWL